MSDWNRIEWFLASARFAWIVWSAVAAPSHGPAKGYLLITGGAPDYKRFI